VTSACGQRDARLSTTASQTYTIEAYELGNNQVVDYTLSLLGVSQAFTCGISMAYGDLETGKIDIIGDTDVFNFDGRQNEDVSITVSRRSGDGLPCWQLFDPDGTSVTSACGQRTAALPKTGKYTIKVYELGNNQVVDYTLSLQRVGGS
jgi:hypothetical protein